MDNYVKNFIAMSIFYLTAASILGILMFLSPNNVGFLKFAHSHLMLIGWVTMMIYGVGYHILPRFAGQLIKNRGLAVGQFWIANAGLIGMVIFYTLMQSSADASAYRMLAVGAGVLEIVSIMIFFFNMVSTIFAKPATD